MRIKKLEIFGFKSFATKQSILFGEGITAVVGPNGCGKSNVVDALRWVMGEQNPHRLRGSAMQDIIFCGSDKKGPLGFAEVILTIENNKSDAPLEYNNFHEIEICRRLYKTGESEYLINKQKARLKDVADFFLGTGVGTKAYSIIEQGRVNDITSAKPQDRRLIIEEAAGISKYKAKKAAAERRMESCSINLSRIVDIKNEVDKRVLMLAKEKEKLSKVQTIKQKIKDIDLHNASHEYLSNLANLKFLETNKRLFQDQLLDNERDRAFFEQNFDKILNEFTEKNDKKRLLIDLENQHKNTLQLLIKDLSFTKSSAIDSKSLIERLTTQLDETLERYQELDKDINRYEKETGAITSERKEIEELFVKKRDDGRQIIEERHKYIIKEQDIQRKILAAATNASKLQTEINMLRNHSIERAKEIKQIGADLLQKTHEETEAQNHVMILRQEQNIGLEKKSFLLSKKTILNTENKDTDLKYQQTKKQLALVKDEQTRLTTRFSSLKEIDEKLLWTESGAGLLMASPHSHLIKNIIANVIKAKPGSEEEVEKAFGNLLDAAIVTNDQDLLTIVDVLRSHKSAKTTLFMLDSAFDTKNISRPLGLLCLNDLLSIDGQEYQTLRFLCSRYFIAKDLKDALPHWAAARLSQATIVSLQGEILLPDGQIVVSGQNNGQGILKRKKEIFELDVVIKSKLQEVQKIEQLAKELAGKNEALKNDYETVCAELNSLEIGLVRLEEKLNQKNVDLNNLIKTIEKLKTANTSIQENQSSYNDKIEELNKLWAKALDEHKFSAEDLDSNKSQKIAVDEKYDSFQQELKTIEINRASLYEKSTSLKQTIEQAQKSRDHLLGQKQAFINQIEEKSGDEIKLKEYERQTQVNIEALEKELKKIKTMLENLSQDLEKISQDKNSKEQELAELRTAKQSLVELLHGQELSIQNCTHDINSLIARIFERYRLDLVDFIYDYHQVFLDKENSKKESNELKRSLERLGSVNENAHIEHEELYQRSHFLHTQISDLNDSLSQLDSAIKKINKATKARFTEAFTSINEKFSLVFPRLFNGGFASLVLINDEDILNCGVDIIAKPPGKHIGSIELMSGGEKALTAISLIMAIFLIKPSPFCLLDEVDAPLDETNVVRFNQLIKDVSRLSQFIVITHNRKTMESADQLYGVTMEEAGQSKIVSVHIKEAYSALKKIEKTDSAQTALPL